MCAPYTRKVLHFRFDRALYCQPTTSELTIVGLGHLSINLKPGTNVHQAADVAQYLAEHIESISFTK